MKTSQNKFVFLGTPRVSAEILEILKRNGYLPSLIITSPDKPVGRRQIITSPPVKNWAQENNVPVLQPESLTTSPPNPLPLGEGAGGEVNLIDKLSGFDLFIVVAYGKILPEELINLPKCGTLNIHYSLLPKYRGASPVEAAILAGDSETGVSIQRMEFKLDSGPILAEEKTIIGPDETAPELEARLTELGGNLLIKILPDFWAGKIVPRPQDESAATYCKKIKKEDGEVRLDDPPEILWRKYRAYVGWPRLYSFSTKGGSGKRIIITKAKMKGGQFVIEKIIPEGKKEMDYNI